MLSLPFREKCWNNVVVIMSDCVCHDDDVAEVMASADLAGNVTVGVTSLTDPFSVVTAGVEPAPMAERYEA